MPEKLQRRVQPMQLHGVAPRYIRMEHRCGNRKSIEARVTVRTRGGLVVRGILQNVSASGALVAAPLPVPLHSAVFVQIEAANAHQGFSRVGVPGEVSRVTEDGFAIEWAEFAPHTLRIILRATEKWHHGPKADVG
jgi:hypothetical protein